MKMKTIILITFLLLGILTLGAASAEDNMTSTDLGECDLSDAPANSEEILTSSDNDDNICIEEESVLSKTTPTLNIEATDGVYGENTAINVMLSDNITGNVTLSIGDNNLTLQLTDGISQYVCSGLNAGKYNVTARYFGDENFSEVSNSTLFEIFKANITTSIIVGNITSEEEASVGIFTPAILENMTLSEYPTIMVTAPNDFTGNVSFEINTITYNNPVPSFFKLDKLIEGNYTVNITFYGDNNYNNKTFRAYLIVSKAPPANTTIILTVKGTDVTAILIYAHGPLASSEIIFHINGNEYFKTTDSDGNATLENVLTYGTNNITASYSGNENYSNSNATIYHHIVDPTSFEALQQLINDTDPGETISLTSDYTFNNELDSAFIDGIVINKLLAIDGNGYTINGNGLARIFYINESDIRLSNLNLINTYSISNGGAIYWRGLNGSISNVSISNSTSKMDGGAIYWEGSYATVNNSFFTNTFAQNGGAIYWEGTYSTVNNSFFKNTSAQKGGAIYCNGHGYSMNNTQFINSTAKISGGAIYLEISSSYSAIDGCSFINNTAYANADETTRGGGAIFCERGNILIIRNSKFINNSVKSNTKASGGAILWYYISNGLIDNCIFDGNYVTSTSSYGSYWVQGGGVLLRGQTNNTVSNCIFKNCWSDKDAGALYVSSIGMMGKDNILVTNTSFINNTAKTLGPESYTRGGGGVLVKECDMVLFKNVSFTNNAAKNGGGLHIYPSSHDKKEILFIDCTLKNNTAELNGGGIWAEKNLRLYNVTLCDNYAGSLGGGIYLEKNFYDYSNLTFINNSANKGGGLYWNYNNRDIEGMKFINNSADQGGAIYIPTITGNNKTTVTNNEFTGNRAVNGGAIYVERNNCTINNSNFTSNSATDNGGSIYWAGDYGILKDATIEYSTASENGGAVYWEGEWGVVENVDFLRSSAKNGGAVYVEDKKNVTLEKSNFEENHAAKGSAIYGGTHSDCVFSNNDNIVVYPEERLDTSTVISIDKNSLTIGDAISISINVSTKNGEINGSVDLYINDGLYKTVKVNEVITYTPKTATTYSIYAKFNESDVYLGSKSATKIISVYKKTPQVLVSYHDIALGENETITVTLPGDASGTVNITLFKNNTIIDSNNVPVTSGIVKTEFFNLNFGVYTANIKYSGDSQYQGFNHNVTFVVRPDVFITQNVTKEGDILIFADLIDDTGEVYIKIDNRPLDVVEIVDNKINYTFSTKKHRFGDHIINIEYWGYNLDKNIFNTWDEKTNTMVSKDFELYIAPAPLITETNILSTEDVAEITVKLQEDAEGTITFFVNGVEAAVVNIVNGIATFDASMFKNGNYIITWKYSGDSKYAPTTGSSALRVNIIPPRIAAGDMKVTYSDGKKYSVTVYDNKGRGVSGTSVTFLINNKAIGTVKTDSNGVASIKISKTPGSYEITSKALGLSTTKKLIVTHVISLKKVSVKKSSKSLVLTATLKKVNGKYLKGKKITFKFNGKKFTAKTNKKGIAKVTIKKTVLSKLTAGKKVKYQASYLKDTVKKTVKIKK